MSVLIKNLVRNNNTNNKANILNGDIMRLKRVNDVFEIIANKYELVFDQVGAVLNTNNLNIIWKKVFSHYSLQKHKTMKQTSFPGLYM